jgi:hypothetical protein
MKSRNKNMKIEGGLLGKREKIRRIESNNKRGKLGYENITMKLIILYN